MAVRSRVTIKDVAAAAGVSLTTVSDSLSGKGRIPDDTRRRVREVAEQLGYRPNALAQQLRGAGLGLIGYVIAPAAEASMTTVWYWSALMNHATEAALSRSHALVLLPYDPALLQSMRIPVDGAIVVDPVRGDEVLKALRATGMPVVTVGRDLSAPEEPWVDDDTVAGTKAMLTATVRPGERIAVLTLDPVKSYIHDTIQGAQAWAAEHRSPIGVHTVGAFSADELDPALDAILDAERADVIVAQNDRLGMALVRHLRARSVNVPGQVRLVCASDAPELDHARPSVTATRQHPDRVGTLAVEIVIKLIAGQEAPGRTLVPMKTVIRRSAPSLTTRRRTPRR